MDFFDAAVILKHKALWAVQGAKQKQRWQRPDIQVSDLKLGLFHNLEDISEIRRRVVVGADGGRKVQLVDKVFLRITAGSGSSSELKRANR